LRRKWRGLASRIARLDAATIAGVLTACTFTCTPAFAASSTIAFEHFDLGS
jgi:hypothetical protein